MAPRLELQNLLVAILGSSNVYFQPPPTLQLKYPAIVYMRDDRNVEHAGNKPYSHAIRYQVTAIDRESDSLIHTKLANLPLCSFERFFISDNLNHDVFNLFF